MLMRTDPFRELDRLESAARMLPGLRSPWTRHVRVKVEDPGNPAVSHLGENFGLRDEIYVTDFPCPPCAKLIAGAGIERVYYRQGYAVLDGADVLQAAGVEIVHVGETA